MPTFGRFSSVQIFASRNCSWKFKTLVVPCHYRRKSMIHVIACSSRIPIKFFSCKIQANCEMMHWSLEWISSRVADCIFWWGNFCQPCSRPVEKWSCFMPCSSMNHKNTSHDAYRQHSVLQGIFHMPNRLLSTVDMLMVALAKYRVGKRHCPDYPLYNQCTSPSCFPELHFPSSLSWFQVHTSPVCWKGLTLFMSTGLLLLGRSIPCLPS